MRTVIRQAIRTITAGFAAFAMLAPTIASANEHAPAVHVVDRPDERRLVVTIGPLDRAQPGTERTVAVRMPVTAMVYRFQAEMRDPSGRVLGPDHYWGVTIFATPSDEQSWRARPATARLSTGAADVEIKRPYGLRIGAGDSVTFVAALPAEGAEGAMLHLVMEYESVPATRLPALAIASEETVSTGSWTFRVEVSGRLVVISGRQLIGAEILVLEDVTTGEELWRSPRRLSKQDDLIRPAKLIEAGRLYRLRALYASPGPDQTHGGDTPLAIVSPSRPSNGDR